MCSKQKIDLYHGITKEVYMEQLCPTRPAGRMRPSGRLCAPQFRFRCSRSCLHTDDQSLFW